MTERGDGDDVVVRHKTNEESLEMSSSNIQQQQQTTVSVRTQPYACVCVRVINQLFFHRLNTQI